MNKNFYLIAIFMCFGFAVVAQNKEISEAEAYIRKGDSQNLSKYFGNTVELNFDGKKQNYSRNQAEFVMKDFFSKNPPRPDGFESYHRGQPNTNLSFSIVKYDSKNGAFRVFMKLKNQQGKYFIDALDFIRE
jgi:hypothetical protein